MKNALLAVLITTVCHDHVQAQNITPQVINITGNSYSQGYYNIDWSVGELALVDQFQSADGRCLVTNGFIQPFTNLPVIENFEKSFTDDEIKILPNPTRDVLEVNFLSTTRGPVKFILFDERGRALYTKESTSQGFGFIEKIQMSRYVPATYMLYVEVTGIDAGAYRKRRTYKVLKL
jgi:hypothetical protein